MNRQIALQLKKYIKLIITENKYNIQKMYKINIYLLTFINKIFFKHYFIVLFKQTHTHKIYGMTKALNG